MIAVLWDSILKWFKPKKAQKPKKKRMTVQPVIAEKKKTTTKGKVKAAMQCRKRERNGV